MKQTELFSAYALSKELILSNRIVMAPMTRCFADDELAPTDAAIAYYAARADAGLLVTEATLIHADGQGYPHTPGIWSERQVRAWRGVTDAVHDAGGRIFCQLWHTGRMAHSHYTGQQPVAPSAVALQGSLPRARDLVYETPRELGLEDIHRLVERYRQAAQNAMLAGFDGVEIHGANGYLIDQFLHGETNRRVDEYGGSAENRRRFALEVVDAVANAIGGERTAIRLSPQAYVNLAYTEGDEEVFEMLFEALNQRRMAYVHVAAFDADLSYDYLGGRPVDFVRQHYEGTLIGCGGFTPEKAEDELENGRMDLVAFGRSFIANADLVSRIRDGRELAVYDEAMLGSLT